MTASEAIALVSAKIRKFKRKMAKLNDRVPIKLAKNMIRWSAWWFEHPAGPVCAPEHCERIEYDEDHEAYEIRFGGNIFFIEKAIVWCVDDLEDAVRASTATGMFAKRADLYRALHVSITFYVAVFGRRGPHGCYPTDLEGFMHFGAQAISDQVHGLCARTPGVRSLRSTGSTVS